MTTSAFSNTHVMDDGSKAGFAQDLVDAARDNPLATALISMGVLWMAVGGSKGSLLAGAKSVGSATASNLNAGRQSVAAGLSSAASSVSEAASTGYGAAADRVSGLSDAARGTLHDVRDGVGQLGAGVSAMVDDARQKFSTSARTGQVSTGRLGEQVAREANESLSSLSQQFSDILHSNPFAIAAVGLAVGAGVAAALPRIAAEDALTGPVNSFKERLQSELSEAYTRGANEAAAQGLTADAATDALQNVKDKVTKAATGG